MDKYDEKAVIETIPGIGKFYKIPFSGAGLDIARPDYYIYSNWKIGEKEKIFPISSYNLQVAICKNCQEGEHHVAKGGHGDLWHIWFYGVGQIVITKVCHQPTPGSENLYSTWGRRCNCRTPEIKSIDPMVEKYPIKTK
jgi:hypothetical protein